MPRASARHDHFFRRCWKLRPKLVACLCLNLVFLAAAGLPQLAWVASATTGSMCIASGPRAPCKQRGESRIACRADDVPSTAETLSDERKLRVAIESVIRDQDQLRMSTPLTSSKTVFSTAVALTFTVLATASAALPSMGAALLPALTTAVFISCSAAESSCSAAKGISRYNSGQAITIATQQETVLAEAETRKAFLPFGVGLTAIFAAAIVCLKFYGDRLAEEVVAAGEVSASKAETGEDFLLIGLAVAAVVGAVVTSDYGLRMHATIERRPEDNLQGNDDESEWEAQRLPKYVQEAKQDERIRAAVLTVLGCLSPLVYTTQTAEDMDTLVEESTVIVSAIAASFAALTYLFAEKDFVDAERRVAIQSKQGALAELFFAQAQSEAAITPMRTAWGGVASGGAYLAVEFSNLAASLFPWATFVSAFRSILTANLARVEADASWLERRISKKGDSAKRKSDAVASTVRELQRLQADLFPRSTSRTIKEELQQLAPNEQKEFRGLSSEGRRNVHLVAAELGMTSQSVGTSGQRVVIVVNNGLSIDGESTQNGVMDMFETGFFDYMRAEVRRMVTKGVDRESIPALLPPVLLTAFSGTTPLVASQAAANIVLPLATGAVAVFAVWQEKVGKEIVAEGKRQSAVVQRRQAEAESLVGLAMLAASAFPTYLAVATCATALSCVSFFFSRGSMFWWLPVPALVVNLLMLSASTRRQSRLHKYVVGAARTVQAESPPRRRQHGWILPLLLGALLPADFPRRLTMASCGLTAEVAMIVAESGSTIAAGEFYAARGGRVASRADAWAQGAGRACRALPLGTAAVVVDTLLATALTSFATPFGTIFPAVALGISIRALQYSLKARQDAVACEAGCKSIQVIVDQKPPWLYGGIASNFAQAENRKPPAENKMSFKKTPSRLAFSLKTVRSFMGQVTSNMLKYLDEVKPEEMYSPQPAQRTVRSVQADLDELRVSVRSNEKGWRRTGAVVGLCAVGAIISPLVLPELLTEVVLPVAGGFLTLFAVSAESDARRSVAVSKIWAAELNDVACTVEELVSTSQLYKAELVSVTGITATLGVMTFVVEKAWPAPLSSLQALLQVALIVVQAGAAVWSVHRVLQVQFWTARAMETTASSLRKNGSLEAGEHPVVYYNRKASRATTPRRTRWLVWLALVPSLVFAVFPRCRSFSRRAVASTAAGALVVAVSLYFAERAVSRAERYQSARLRTFALADIFSNEAEQQGALLPLTSAATIAFSGLITFVTEINPYTASALTLLQALAWLVASRKAVATKFESAAALQVNSVNMNAHFRSGQEPLPQRIKRLLIRQNL